MNNTANKKVWLVTGTSTGIGLHLVQLLLHTGHKVIATSRRPEKVEEQFPGNASLLALKVDLTNDCDVKTSIEKAVKHFGKIDVVVNNAGYLLIGAIEELTDKEFRDTLNVNLFGTVNVLRATLPHLRKQKRGSIINIASNAGYVGMGNVGSYNAAKFAIIGISEALQKETEPFGIKVTVVAPGQFRTNLWGSDAIKYPAEKIAEYNTDKFSEFFTNGNGKQPGDPDKLAQIIVNLTEMEKPPVHLLLGKDTYDMVIEHRNNEKKEFGDWETTTFSTDFS